MKRILLSCLVLAGLAGCASSPTTAATDTTTAKPAECNKAFPCIRETAGKGESQACDTGK